ncbi:hypothetical protein EQ836_07640 [Ectopseudomonas mendocina]|uniref:Uncharacterized protein n=1 Tax=Ectopseudomonas mendocina TaxID=300 RepID=A0ABD7S0N2_ECTME|nr:hypothetical protein [Pseudomonas mendocina]TRO14338.1 hypothetical protein EQ829_10035 [Pseudomonas mendocina]TRO19389.1 hypothetical protein EQ836_07640 [Pseudomonas mendocina]
MNVPPWGWPWHGRVDRSNVLHLPGGKTMPYFPPDRANHTYRVKVPGVAAIARSPEELAADIALGREWRNEAIMHAHMLYGRELGGWIYCAPDDTRWVIRLSGSAVSFGVLGGAPASQALTVSWPTDDIEVGDELNLGGTPYLVQRWPLPVDVAPDGARAIFMLYANDPSFNVGLRPLPLGFQLVTVGGESGAISVSITTLRTLEQTLGTALFEDLREREARTNRQTWPPHPGTVNDLAPDRALPDPPGTEYATGDWQTGFNYEKSVGTMASHVLGRILALWFDPLGAIIECTMDYRIDIDVNFPEFESTPTSNPDKNRWARITSRLQRIEHELKVDGVTVYTFWQDVSHTQDMFDVPTEIFVRYRDVYQWLMDDGRSHYAEQITDAPMPEDALTPPNDGERLYAGNQWRLLSNNIAVLLRGYFVEESPPQVQYAGCATPQGVVPLSGIEDGTINVNQPAGPLEFACFNPFTGEISDPVGDTVTFV